MWKNVLLLLLALNALGCAALSKSEKPGMPITKPVSEGPQRTMAPGKEPSIPRIKHGLVFGKTDFKGILKTSFVRLTLIRKDATDKNYFFYVGAKENQSVVPWGQGRRIEPGYFYLQLPDGDYEITGIAIPVGSALAEEALAVDFKVTPNKITYLGTLDVTGTKERVHFGGVPIMKPGFEYDLLIKDEFDQAKRVLEIRIPRHRSPVVKELLKVSTVGASAP
jgi:hypothetical protein